MTPIETAIKHLGSQDKLAGALGFAQTTIHQWVKGSRKVPGARCAEIERATDGKVTADALRADLRWSRIPDAAWPHPKGRPVIDPAGPAPKPSKKKVEAQ